MSAASLETKKKCFSPSFHVPKCSVISSNGANCYSRFPFIIFLFMPLASIAQTEISEVFDKLHHVNGSDSAIEVTDTADSSESSPKPVAAKPKPSPRRLNNGVKSSSGDDWNALAQFEKLVKMEVESLHAADKQQKAIGSTTRPKIHSNSLLRPEKHVSFESWSLSLIPLFVFCYFS